MLVSQYSGPSNKYIDNCKVEIIVKCCLRHARGISHRLEKRDQKGHLGVDEP